MNLGETAALLARITELEHTARAQQTMIDELRELIPAARVSLTSEAPATSAQSNLPPSVARGGHHAARA